MVHVSWGSVAYCKRERNPSKKGVGLFTGVNYIKTFIKISGFGELKKNLVLGHILNNICSFLEFWDAVLVNFQP